jgi:DNA damage-binding protein 1
LQDSSLRIVKSGVGVEEQAAVDLEGIKGLWALQEHGADCMLVQSFVGETRVLKLSNDELQESDVPGFDMSSASLLCGNVSPDVYFQVTASEVRLGGAAQVIWPCAFDRITSASADGSTLVLCCKGGLVVKLLATLASGASAAALTISGRVQLSSDIACVSMNSLSPGQWGIDNTMDIIQMRFFPFPLRPLCAHFFCRTTRRCRVFWTLESHARPCPYQ